VTDGFIVFKFVENKACESVKCLLIQFKKIKNLKKAYDFVKTGNLGSWLFIPEFLKTFSKRRI